MKKLLISISFMLMLVSCSFNAQDELVVALWFKWLIAIVIVLVILIVMSAIFSGNEVSEYLKNNNLSILDFKKCGTYIGGHPALDVTVEGISIRKSETKIEIYRFPSISEIPVLIADIPINSISGINVEDSSSMEKRITLGRVLLVGIFALAWRKKKKNELAFVTIEWKEKFENSTIFSFEGQEAMQKANTARNELIKMCR